jgi:hypothetical protein
MARVKTIRNAPVAAVVEQAPVAIGAPSAEARVMAFERGANIDAMLAVLRERLLDVCHMISQVLELMPDGDFGLRTLRSKLSLAAGEIGLFSP